MPSRPYYHYSKCEEYAPDGGMWRNVSGARRVDLIAAAASLMRRPDEFEAAMIRALREWPNSCAVNLSTPTKNRRAWLGHAGTFLATGSPEECTRIGWHTLEPSAQRKANLVADTVIKRWRYGVDARQLSFGEVPGG